MFSLSRAILFFGALSTSATGLAQGPVLIGGAPTGRGPASISPTATSANNIQIPHSIESKAVNELMGDYGTLPIKADIYLQKGMKFLSSKDQSYFYPLLKNKSAMQSSVTFERVSANQVNVRFGEKSALLEVVSLSHGKFKINGVSVQFKPTQSSQEIDKIIKKILNPKSAAVHRENSFEANRFALYNFVWASMFKPAWAQDFGSLIGPILTLAVTFWVINQQAEAECSAVNDALNSCNKITKGEGGDRVGGAGLEYIVQLAAANSGKSLSALAEKKCGRKIPEIQECVKLAQFELQYGRWKPCSDPHKQEGGFVAVGFSIPCPATDKPAVTTGRTANVPGVK